MRTCARRRNQRRTLHLPALRIFWAERTPHADCQGNALTSLAHDGDALKLSTTAKTASASDKTGAKISRVLPSELSNPKLVRDQTKTIKKNKNISYCRSLRPRLSGGQPQMRLNASKPYIGAEISGVEQYHHKGSEIGFPDKSEPNVHITTRHSKP